MPTYTIDLKVPNSNLEELIEILRTVGAVESLQFSIEAPTHQAALQETRDVLQEYSATYRDGYLKPTALDSLAWGLHRGPERIATDF